jgi:GMP synthase (glutamine-hydrolysing)
MEKIAILDYGSQLTHLLATEVRRLGVYSEILEPEVAASDLIDYKGIILSGGPNSVYDSESPQVDEAIFDLGIPILGICYGHQLMTHKLGGIVQTADIGEYGKADIEVVDNAGMLEGFDIGEKTQVWMSHRDSITELPDGFQTYAQTEDCPYAVIGDPARKFYSIQFHLEVVHTVKGRQMLKNFLNQCDVSFDWNLEDFLTQKTDEIQQAAGENKVFLLVSGGVDSTVAFALLEKALGKERVYGMFVDIGFMRKNEVEEVSKALRGIGVDDLHVYSGADEYFTALEGKYEPESKRKVIGDLFLDIQAKVSEDLKLNPDEWLLGQGTIYPDTIESGGTKHADKIKTHHNRVQRIQDLMEQGKIIEPIKDLYKDEVRKLGELLGLPHEMVQRHPFPGPGLAVRILCTHDSVDPDDSELEAINADLSTHGLSGEILPIKSVGVQGDGRTYRFPLAVHGDWPGYEKLAEISTALTNKYRTINRVIFQFKPKDSTDFETVKNRYLTPDRTNLLQEADAIFTRILKESGHYSKIWQSPVVLLPVHSANNPGESIVLRPISSREAMTADVYPLPIELVQQFVERVEAQNLPISAVFYDLTNKPPGTIEWE